VGVVFSEFALNHPNAWNFIRPILRENGGWAAFISTPRGRNHLWDQLEIAKKNPSYFCQHFDAYQLHQKHGGDCTICGGEGEVGIARMLEEERNTGMPEGLIRQEYLCDFAAANVGSVFGDLIERLQKAGRVYSFEARLDNVFATLDLGFGDATAIWWWRLREGGVEVLDHYANRGQTIEHYKNVLWERPWARPPFGYAKVWLPHDARAHHLTGTSVVESFLSDPRFGPSKVSLVTQMSLQDGIHALLMPRTRFHIACDAKGPLGYSGLQALREYHYEWDDGTRILTRKPVHDWASNSADAWRYIGVVAKVAKFAVPEQEAARPNGITLEELFEARSEESRDRRL
jgi:hypothetical protein